MSISRQFVEYLSTKGYHPRSSEHSDFLSECIIAELVEHCPKLNERAKRGEVVGKLRHHQRVGHNDWVIDIAIGSCAGRPVPPESGLMRIDAPAIIQIAIELKSIITEHGKARKNRLRDFEAFHSYAHQYDPKTVAAAFLAVNSAESFYSPLRARSDITNHATTKKSARQVAADAVNLFRAIPLRHRESDPPGLEAMGVIVIEHDNLAFHSQKKKYAPMHVPTQIAPIPPSLPIGDPMHYQTMIQRICQAYTQRF